jgi:hypothetical protein
MHIFNVSTATVHFLLLGLKNVNLKVWEKLITQSRCCLFKTYWNNYQVQLHVNFLKTVKNFQKVTCTSSTCMSITSVQGLKNVSLTCERSCLSISNTITRKGIVSMRKELKLTE